MGFKSEGFNTKERITQPLENWGVMVREATAHDLSLKRWYRDVHELTRKLLQTYRSFHWLWGSEAVKGVVLSKPVWILTA